VSVLPEDLNYNGIPDAQEVDVATDMDGDGIPDINQADEIKSIKTVVGDFQIGVKKSTNTDSILSVKSIDPETIADTIGKPNNMPFGLISFKIAVSNEGDTAKVDFFFLEPLNEDVGWAKYDLNNGWWDYSEYISLSEDGKIITLEITDGGLGDADGTANRIYVDPSGPVYHSMDEPAEVVAFPGPGDSGGGCFVGSMFQK